VAHLCIAPPCGPTLDMPIWIKRVMQINSQRDREEIRGKTAK